MVAVLEQQHDRSVQRMQDSLDASLERQEHAMDRMLTAAMTAAAVATRVAEASHARHADAAPAPARDSPAASAPPAGIAGPRPAPEHEALPPPPLDKDQDQEQREAEGLLKLEESSAFLHATDAFNGPDSGAGGAAAAANASAALCINSADGAASLPDNTDYQAFDALHAKKDVLAPWMVSVSVVEPQANGAENSVNTHADACNGEPKEKLSAQTRHKVSREHTATHSKSKGLAASASAGALPELNRAASQASAVTTRSVLEEERSQESWKTGGFHSEEPEMYSDKVKHKRYSVQQARRMKALSQGDSVPAPRPSQSKMPSLLKRIVYSPWFDLAAACLLLSNAAVIGLQVEASATMHIGSTADSGSNKNDRFEALNMVFCFLFVLELLMRVSADGCRDFLSQGFWSWFDILVISVQVTETFSIMLMKKSNDVLQYAEFGRLIRVARVVRVIRVFRVMRFFRAFRVLLTMIFGTMKNGAWATMLLVMIMYVFAIIFTQSTSDHFTMYAEGAIDSYDSLTFYFGTVPRAILTLFKSIIGGIDWEAVVLPLSDIGPQFVFLFMMYISFVQLVVMNVVTGFFLQSAIEQAQADQEQAVQMRLREKKIFIHRLNQLFEELDSSHDGSITLSEFRAHLQNEHMQALLQTFDIDDTDAWTLFKLLDRDEGGSVDLEEFVEGCIRLKGQAKSIQIAELMCQHKWMMDKLSEIFEVVSSNLEAEKAIKREIKTLARISR